MVGLLYDVGADAGICIMEGECGCGRVGGELVYKGFCCCCCDTGLYDGYDGGGVIVEEGRGGGGAGYGGVYGDIEE
jgi:hypothetical protein